MGGWFKQQRNLTERPWFKDAQMVQVYLFLKERAYVTAGMYEGQLIRRGSCPVTRPEISEMTGINMRTLDRVLRRLIECGEIIIKSSNRFSVISVCDYDGCEQPESLFGTTGDTTNGITDGTTGGTTDGTTHILTIEERRNKEEDNLRSLFNPSKNERENNKGVIYEIKKLYNKKFEDVLPEWKRLSDKMAIKVATCISRYGRQSVDMVFDQVLHEKFSLGDNKTGFIADFDFIFRLSEYEKYLSRYELRLKKGSRGKTMECSVGSNTEDNREDGKNESEISVEPQQKKEFTRRDLVLSWVKSYSINPTQSMRNLLMRCLESGELNELGIEWKPNIQQAI